MAAAGRRLRPGPGRDPSPATTPTPSSAFLNTLDAAHRPGPACSTSCWTTAPVAHRQEDESLARPRTRAGTSHWTPPHASWLNQDRTLLLRPGQDRDPLRRLQQPRRPLITRSKPHHPRQERDRQTLPMDLRRHSTESRVSPQGNLRGAALGCGRMPPRRPGWRFGLPG